MHGLRRRNRSGYHFGCFGADHALYWQTNWVSRRSDAAALGGVELIGRAYLGRLVGFNSGSALAAGTLATSAFVATRLGAAAAAIGWSAAEWIRNGKPSALGAISGCVAGLVAITPASGFVSPMSAIVIGLIAGAFCFYMVVKVKSWFGYDDSLDAFGVHGAGGTIGALLTGLFARSAINPVFGAGKATGVLEGNTHQIWNQAMGVAIAWGLAIVGTLLILVLVDKTIGLRVSEAEEREGLDLTQHGEEGYEWAH